VLFQTHQKVKPEDTSKRPSPEMDKAIKFYENLLRDPNRVTTPAAVRKLEEVAGIDESTGYRARRQLGMRKVDGCYRLP